MKERRIEKRFYLRALLQLTDTAEYSNVAVESINVSAGGILFRSSANIKMGETLNLFFSLPGRDETVEAMCTVVHNLETIPGKQYFIGVRFDKISGISFEELSRFLKDEFGEEE